MATAQQYEAVLFKAERLGLGSLSREEGELLARLYKEAGARGNRARKVIDGR